MRHPPRSHSRPRPVSGDAGEQATHLYNEGVTLQAEGKTTLAESAFRRAISKQPEFAEAHNNLGNVLLEQKKWKAAEKSFRRALQLLPDNAMLMGNIGKALHHQGKTVTALEILQQAIRLEPRSVLAIHTLGTVYMQDGKTGEAIEQFDRARELRPDSPEIASDLGAALCKQKRYKEAVDILHATVKAYPGYFAAYPNLAEAAFEIGAVDDAVKVLEEALKLAPENDAVHARLAEIQYARQDYLAARTAITRATGINRRNAAHCNLHSKILCRMNLTDEAAAMAHKAIALQEDEPSYHHTLGVALMMAGKHLEAREPFRRALRLQPDQARSHLMLAQVTHHQTHDEEMCSMEALLADSGLSDQHAICLHFGLGKAFDDIGDYAQAFGHFERGNTLRQDHSTTGHDDGLLFRTLAATFSHECLQQHRDSGYRGVTPLFITGLPRSGKTVLETILARHPQVTAGGESGDFTQVAREIVTTRTGADFPDGTRELQTGAITEIGRAYVQRLQQRLGQVDYATNTSPGMTRYIGMLRLCLPEAKLILCQREARDQCTEIYKKNLGAEYPYGHDLEKLGGFYLQYQTLMDYWRRLLPGFIHVVQFEELLRDPENQVNALLDFCGLSREAGCLDREKLPKTENSVGLWQHYREPLKPLFAKLENT